MKNIITLFLDIVFPPNCRICGKKMGLNRCACYCSDCWKTIKIIKEPICIYCGKQLTLPDEHFCGDCSRRKLSFLDNRSACVYEGIVKDALHEFKYKSRKTLLPFLSDLMIEQLKVFGGAGDVDIIIPVPVYSDKKEKREYNQAELLADRLGKAFKLPVVNDVLVRTADTLPQYNLAVEERFKNVNGAFMIKNPAKIKWACILLIDDLLTTGATADECSKMLLAAGASQIRVFTLARGV